MPIQHVTHVPEDMLFGVRVQFRYTVDSTLAFVQSSTNKDLYFARIYAANIKHIAGQLKELRAKAYQVNKPIVIPENLGCKGTNIAWRDVLALIEETFAPTNIRVCITPDAG